MYDWMVYLHVLAVFAFLLAHGVSTIVIFRLRGRPDPAEARAWMELYINDRVFAVLYGSLLLLLVTGIVAAFMGNWWNRGWVWLSLALLVGIIAGMWLVGTRHMTHIRKALGMPHFNGRTTVPAAPPAPPDEIDALLATAPALPVALIGFGGLAAILWLMMFKPF
jgi:uncharacterized membrane protein